MSVDEEKAQLDCNNFCPLFSKDARLPVQLQRAMAAEAEAAREARAKVAKDSEQRSRAAFQSKTIQIMSRIGPVPTRGLDLRPRSEEKQKNGSDQPLMA